MDQEGQEIPEEIPYEEVAGSNVMEDDIKIVSKLEEFSCSPNFTNSIQTFMQENCFNFVEVQQNGEHSIDNYLLFKKYVQIIESCLEEFLLKENIKVDKLLESCRRIREIDENSLYCLDYILAGVEYEDFYNLMKQYKDMYNYEYEDNNFEFEVNK